MRFQTTVNSPRSITQRFERMSVRSHLEKNHHGHAWKGLQFFKMDSCLFRWLYRSYNTEWRKRSKYICYPDGSFTSRSIPAGSPVTNYRAELTAIQEATHLLRKLATTDSNIVILTNSKSSIEGLVCPKDQLEREELNLLSTISMNTMLAVQWISSHCGIPGNEEADKLAKAGRDEPQHNPPDPTVRLKVSSKTCLRRSGITGTIHQKWCLATTNKK